MSLGGPKHVSQTEHRPGPLGVAGMPGPLSSVGVFWIQGHRDPARLFLLQSGMGCVCVCVLAILEKSLFVCSSDSSLTGCVCRKLSDPTSFHVSLSDWL